MISRQYIYWLRLINNNKDPKSQVGDHVTVSKYKNVFAKGYTPNWSEEAFAFKKVKNTMSWTYVINDLNSKEIFGTLYEKELQKTNQQEFSMKKVIKRIGKKHWNFKWKGYDNLFNSWIDKNDVIYKWVKNFLNHMNHLKETLMLNKLCNKSWFKKCIRNL